MNVVQHTLYWIVATVAIGWAALSAQPPLGESRPCKVVSVYDGDTVVIEFIPQRARVRLIDCWCPEVRTKDKEEKSRGIKARDYLKSLAEGKDAVLFTPHQRDIGRETTLGRVLGRLYVDGRDLSELMVESGHATKMK